MAETDIDYDIGEDKPSKTYQKRVGCGHIYITFREHNNGNFDRVLVRGSMSKSSPCGESWLWAISDLLTFALRRAMKEDDETRERGIVNQLAGHFCNNRCAGVEISCASAIGRAVKEYLKEKR